MSSDRPRELAPAKRPLSPSARVPASSSQPLPKRSKKIDQACANCRTLRRKCSGETPCSSCSSNGLTCNYISHADRATKMTLSSAVEHIARLEDRLRAYESLESIDDQLQNAQRSASGRGVLKMDANYMAPLLRGTNQVNRATRHLEFYGPSSSDTVLDTMETSMNNEKGSRLAQFGQDQTEHSVAAKTGRSTMNRLSTAILPPKSIVDRYVQKYFTTFHRLYPILEERTFWVQYSQFWVESSPRDSDDLWLALLYLLLALGHQLAATELGSPSERVLDRSDHGSAYFTMAKSAFADVYFSGGDLVAVQCMFLGFVWLYNEQRHHEAYLMLGAAATAGYGIGLHRDASSSDADSGETQSRTATWWCIFINETQLAALLGRPCSVQPDEVDVPPFPPDDPSVELRYVERMRQLSRLTWDAYYQTYSLSWRNTAIGEREKGSSRNDGALLTWHAAWKLTKAEVSHGIIIDMNVLNIRILLCRPFLALVVQRSRKDQTSGDTGRESAARCVELSIALITLITTTNFESDGTLHASLFQAAHFLWGATLSLLLYITDGVEEGLLDLVRDKIEEHIQIALSFFLKYGQCLPTAHLAADNTKRLLSRANGESQSGEYEFDFLSSIETSPPDAFFDFMPFSDLPSFGWNDS